MDVHFGEVDWAGSLVGLWLLVGVVGGCTVGEVGWVGSRVGLWLLVGVVGGCTVGKVGRVDSRVGGFMVVGWSCELGVQWVRWAG